MKKKPIRKVQFWRNPSPLGGGARWDADVTLEDGSRERRTRITLEDAIEILRDAIR